MSSGAVEKMIRHGRTTRSLVEEILQAIRALDALEVEHLFVRGMAAVLWGQDRGPTDHDLLVNDVSKAHTALRMANFHVSRRGRKRKAWIRSGSGNGVVNLDINQDAALVASIHTEEMVKSINHATPGLLLLAMTLQGLSSMSRGQKVDHVICYLTPVTLIGWPNGFWTMWFSGRRNTPSLLTLGHRENWANARKPDNHAKLLDFLRKIN